MRRAECRQLTQMVFRRVKKINTNKNAAYYKSGKRKLNAKIFLKTCAFIGRFQPFHLGHLDAIKQILKWHKKW